MRYLRGENFHDVYVEKDKLGKYYTSHLHESATGFVLSGEIELIISGKTKFFNTDKRFNVKSGEVYSAKIGE